MKNERSDIDITDLEDFPVWYYDPEAELFTPLRDLDSPIGSIDELHFYSKIFSGLGHEFEGVALGRGDVAIGIYKNNRWYTLNAAWKELSMEQLNALIVDSGLEVRVLADMFPFRIKTQIRREPFIDWEVDFDFIK